MTIDMMAAPPPLWIISGNRIKDERNAAIEAGAYRPTPLSFWERRAAQKRLKRLNRYYSDHRLNDLLAEYHRLRDEHQQIIEQQHQLKLDYQQLIDDYTHRPLDDDGNQRRAAIRDGMATARDNLADVRRDMARANEILKPHRHIIRDHDAVQAQLAAHQAAVADIRKEDQDRRALEKEVKALAAIIRDRWAQMGYCYRATIGKKSITHKVQFERIVVTSDEIMFKIRVASVGLFSMTKNHLPLGVRVSDLIRPETLMELTVACQRQIDCPVWDDDDLKTRGAWLRMQRLGLPDGIQNNVPLAPILDRYPAHEADALPLPLGIRSGRNIDWVMMRDRPHIMVNGITDSGKTNVFRVAMTTMVSKLSPDDVRFLVIDLKNAGDFRDFEGVPHLIRASSDSAIITTVEATAELVTRLRMLMQDRLKFIGRVTNNIKKYNARFPANKMPHIVLFFDEYGMVEGPRNKELAAKIHSEVMLIGQQGRAAGIHLFIGMQQSYANQIPSGIKANIGYMLVGSQATPGASMSAIGDKSAYSLPDIKGRFMVSKGAQRYPVQVPFAADEDITRAISKAAELWPNAASVDLPELPTKEVVNLTVEKLIDIVMNDHDGVLKHSVLWESLKDSGLTTWNELRRLVAELGAMTIEHDGITYIPRKQKGNFIKFEARLTEAAAD